MKMFLSWVGWLFVLLPAHGQTILTSGDGTEFSVQSSGRGGLEAPMNLNGWPQLCVRQCAGADCDTDCADETIYDAQGIPAEDAVDGDGAAISEAVVTAPQRLAGLTVRRHIFASKAVQDDYNNFLRYVDELTNETDADITVMVRLGTMVHPVAGAALDVRAGSLTGGYTRIHKTSTDDADFDLLDRWLVADDDVSTGGLPNVGILHVGAGSRGALSNLWSSVDQASGNMGISWEFRGVVVPAKQSIRILTAIVVDDSRDETIAELENLKNPKPNELLAQLTNKERNELYNFDVTVDAAAPVADAGGPYVIEQGQPLSLRGASSFDLEGGALTYAWDLTDGDGANFEDSSDASDIIRPDPTQPIGRQLLQVGSLTVALKVTDANGKSDIDNATVTVRNTPPSISDVITEGQVDGQPEVGQVDEGSTLTVTILMNELNFIDPYKFDIDWNADDSFGYEAIGNVLGGEPAVNPNRYSATVIYEADGQYKGRIRVRDDDGGRVELDFMVTVNNVAPRVEDVLPPPIQLINEGEFFDISSVATDPGDDPLRYEYTLDGCEFLDGKVGREVVARCPDNQTYVLRAEVCDDGTPPACGTRETLIQPVNVAPRIIEISTSPAEGIREGEPLTVQVAATDQGDDTLLYEFDFDGDGVFEIDERQPEATATYVYGRPGQYEVLVRVWDGVESVIGRTRLTVENALPSATIEGPGQAALGQTNTYTCRGEDPGQALFSYHWDTDGDGLFERRNASETLAIAFDGLGERTINCEVTDGEGGRVQATRRIFVYNGSPPSVIAEVISDPSGMEEGAEITVRVTTDGEQNDELRYTYYFDAGTTEDDLVDDEAFKLVDSPDSTVRFAYPQQGRYRIKVVVTDVQNTFTRDARTDEFEIRNVVPTLRILPLQTVLNEGDQATVIATVSDPGDDEITVHWDLDGDGERDGVSDVVPRGAAGRVMRTFTVPDNDVEVIRAWAHDDDDPQMRESESTLAVRINNVAPIIPDGWMPSEAYEGEVYLESIYYIDPAGFYDEVSFTLTGSPPAGIFIDELTSAITSTEDGELWVPTYEQYRDNNPLRLQVRLTDDDGGVSLSLIEIPIIPIDEDEDGLPDTYEKQTFGVDDPEEILPDGDEDEDGLSNETEWREGTDPTVYDGPGQTRLVAPENETRLETSTPQLVAARVTEPVNGERARIEFQIYADEDGDSLVIASDPIEQPDEGDTRWAVPAGVLDENAEYWWRARSLGERLQTQWSESWRFKVDAINSVPTKPVLIDPVDGTVIGDLDEAVVFKALPSVDEDADEITYTIRWFKQDPLTGQVTTTSARGEIVTMDDEPQVHFTAPPLSEDTTYSWDVIAQDTRSGLAESDERWRFHVDAKNANPTTPSLTMEQGDAFVELKALDSGDNFIAPVADSRPTFRAEGSEDLENDPIAYVFEVVDTDEMVVVASEAIPANEDGIADWRTPDRLEEDAYFTARVYAVDERAGESERVAGIFQVSGQNEPPPMPTHISPTDGSELSPRRAIAIWSEVVDPEGTPVKYIVEYCLSDGECERGAPQPETSYAFEFLGQDGRSVRWSVQAVDADGLGSARTEPWAFTFNVVAENSATSESQDGCNCHVGDDRPHGPLVYVLFGIGLFILRPRRKPMIDPKSGAP
ncbi:MAG: PKD domain-containing protein [Myxococcota bacterium]|nr:PKD domain-containing protein [Myxococcota bacterium]